MYTYIYIHARAHAQTHAVFLKVYLLHRFAKIVMFAYTCNKYLYKHAYILYVCKHAYMLHVCIHAKNAIFTHSDV